MRAEAQVCPFCGASWHSDAAPRSRFAGVLLGLALAGCGVKNGGDPQDTVADETTEHGTSTGEQWSITDVNSAGCMTYAGPSCWTSEPDDTWSDTESQTSDGTSGTTETSEGTSGSETSTDSSGDSDTSSDADTSGAGTSGSHDTGTSGPQDTGTPGEATHSG